MAIAFVAAADLGNNGGSTNNLTAAYTCSGNLLIIPFAGDTAAGADDITGVTFNGVSATFLAKVVAQASQDRNFYFYYLLNPAAGTHNVVVSCTGNHYLLVGAADYTGVNASGQPDASTTHAASGTSLTTSITTVTDNDWVILGEESPGGTISAGTGAVERKKDGAFTTWGLYDSNGAVTPAGSYSMTTNENPSGLVAHILGAFAPTGAATTAKPSSLPMMGAGLVYHALRENPVLDRRSFWFRSTKSRDTGAP